MRDDQLMYSVTSESSRHIHFDSLHSTTSTDTMKQSNRFSRRRLRDANNSEELAPNHESVSDSNLSSVSLQSDEHRRVSQHTDDNEDCNNDIDIIKVPVVNSKSAITTDEQQDLSTSTAATTISTTTTADDMTKCTTLFIGHIDESLVNGTQEER